MDFAGPSVIEAAAWWWLVNRRGLGLYHDDSLGGGQAQVVESLIGAAIAGRQRRRTVHEVRIERGDWRIGGIWCQGRGDLVVRAWSPDFDAGCRAAPEAI